MDKNQVKIRSARIPILFTLQHYLRRKIFCPPYNYFSFFLVKEMYRFSEY